MPWADLGVLQDWHHAGGDESCEGTAQLSGGRCYPEGCGGENEDACTDAGGNNPVCIGEGLGVDGGKCVHQCGEPHEPACVDNGA